MDGLIDSWIGFVDWIDGSMGSSRERGRQGKRVWVRSRRWRLLDSGRMGDDDDDDADADNEGCILDGY